MSLVDQRRGRDGFTWDDLAGEPDDGLRREIIGGALIVNPAPVGRHQLAAQRLWSLLDERCPSSLQTVIAPFDWRYDEAGSVEPDVMVCRSQDFDLDGPLVAPAVPVLIVEVLSPSNAGYDRLLKRDLYQRLGVVSYWMVYPGAPDRDPAITALRLDDGGTYQVAAEATGAEPFTVEHPFPVTFTPADLLRR